MRRSLVFTLVAATLLTLGCREGLEFDLAYTADDTRGKTLIKENCANTCHPSDAFTRQNKKIKNYSQLAYAVRDYYEQVVGDDQNYSQQDIFDMSRYLNRTYYHYHSY